jgi:Protein of unknown function (DUF1592)
MPVEMRSLVVVLCCVIASTAVVRGEEKKPYTGPTCTRTDDYFTKEVWPKVASAMCVNCHKEGGDAEGSKLVLQDPDKVTAGETREQVLRHNREAFARLARVKVKDQSRLLIKVTGGLKHGGKDVLKPDSTGYRVLAEFVRRLDAPTASLPVVDESKLPPFFKDVVMLEPSQLLRRVTLSLVGRLPTDAEKVDVAAKGMDALPALLDAMMKEEAFSDRIREGFNDIFLTLGVDGNPDQVILDYEHFQQTRQWYAKFDLSHVPEKDRQKARYKLTDDYRKAVLAEPMQLIDYIIKNDRPFTEVVTADYIMVSPYSARGYGVFDELKAKFKNPEDPFEFVPVKLKALKGRSRSTDQESATGAYPHAGLLSTFQYLRRYPTTETNRNRLRARMFYLHFLGVDALELAARVSDAATATAKYPIPTMQASECVVCHKTIDPVAGCFQDYYEFEATYGRRKGGWYKDMFEAGFEGETLPAKERWRALQWLGERTAKDPRFSVAMVEHVYYILTGRRLLLPPKDLDDPMYSARRRAYQEQRRQVDAIATRFSKSGFNLKTAFKDWIISDLYRADALAVSVTDPQRQAELADIGVHRMLAPEQVERKITAIFGQPWGKLQDRQGAVLYGGIDSKEVTERATDPSGAMGAIQRTLANEIAARNTLRDFMRKPAERRLFPGIEPTAIPGSSPEADATIRKAIVLLHERILGRNDAVDSAEVSRTFDLFAGVVADAKGRKFEKAEIYHARANLSNAPADPSYTIRAWRAVVTYLLRRPEFLYE